ncbi:hemoglobin subunit alpha-1-like [Solea senegalensis]|uniref:Hemoglobin subunit alpha-1-like n=1 Tax=Solea senegalensis TaxID=28829 RepID=A0AAV6RR67_SOLSE|nr:hemoglobin, alpha embryonic 5 [Solea senegalensis]KAG7507449.1 hemoglobin subunit alpha-1-like [Solea senegalensis]
MSLTDNDIATVKAIWPKIAKVANEVGPESLARMLCIYPQTKIYFSHWSDLSIQSTKVKEHGVVIMKGLSLAVEKINDMANGLQDLSQKHAFQMRVDPANFRLLSQCIHVVLAKRFKAEYTPEVHLAMDKFLSNVALAIAEKYR